MPNMPREQMEWIDHKLYHRQAVKFKAFLINIALMLLVWLMCKSGMMTGVAADSGIPAEFMRYQMMGWMMLWKISAVVLFLVPALAIWWERKCIEHHNYQRERETRATSRRR